MPTEQGLEIWHTWFSERAVEHIAGLAAFVAILIVMGYFSLRFLHGLPDFEHKRKMLWGAKWFWAVMLAAAAVAYTTIYIGITRTPYPITSLLLGLALFHLIIGLSLSLLHHQAHGAVAVIHWLRYWMKGERFDFDSWVVEQRRTSTKQWCLRMIAGAVALLVPAVLAYCAFVWCYAQEREFLELQRTLSLGQVLTHELESPVVEGVFPGTDLRHEPYRLLVRVRPDATPEQAQALLQRAEQCLAGQREPRRWRIEIAYPEKGDWKVLAAGTYDPRTSRRPHVAAAPAP
ncbi:MAG: hypothetical protein PVH68_17440 [Armatimonadota bacterium]